MTYVLHGLIGTKFPTARLIVTGSTRLRVESLEVRDCPATVNLFNGVLTVDGTSGNDYLAITRNGDWILAEGQAFAFNSITRVVVTAGAGNDVIVDGSDKSAVIYGGDGNDMISGGVGRDKIYGGNGDDNIDSGRGDDMIYGGGGNDYLNGGAGVNAVYDGSPMPVLGNTAVEGEIVQLVNAYRAANGLGPLNVNGQLNVAADLHTRDMAAIGGVYGPGQGMQHTLYGTTRPRAEDRLAAAGYDEWTYSYTWGENIAYGFTSASAVVNAWMNSPGHRANILNPTFTEIGVSVRSDANGVLYYTQNFGARA